MDAVDQDAACGWCALSDLPAVHSVGSVGQPCRSDRCDDAHQPADHRLDALYLFPRNPGRDPRGGADGRGDVARRGALYPHADGHSRHRVHHAVELHPCLERSLLDAEPDGRQRGASDSVHRNAIPAPRVCSLRNSARPRPWPLHQSSSLAGSARNNLSAA